MTKKMLLKTFQRMINPRTAILQFSWLVAALLARLNYTRVLRRLKREIGLRKLRCVFFVNEVSKWKVQSLYDLMKASCRFEFVIALDLPGRYLAFPEDEQIRHMSRNRKFFEAMGMECVDARFKNGRKFDLKSLKPDVVFYQQPWNGAVEATPYEASSYALTCYVPYFVATYGCPVAECTTYFHRMLWRHFVPNDIWVRYYSCAMPQWAVAGRMLGLGHTGLDPYYLRRNDHMEKEGYVIYAPHWSFDHPGNKMANVTPMGTFMENGRLILEFAQRHPEIKWAFKPHPLLYTVLFHSGYMTKEEVDAYYDAWKKIGLYHDTPDYFELFMKSRAMITEAGSFTVEYPGTGNPIIQMLSDCARTRDPGPLKYIYDSYYQTNNNEELLAALDHVLVRGEDPKRDERLSAVAKAKLWGNYAAGKIFNHLMSELGVCE